MLLPHAIEKQRSKVIDPKQPIYISLWTGSVRQGSAERLSVHCVVPGPFPDQDLVLKSGHLRRPGARTNNSNIRDEFGINHNAQKFVETLIPKNMDLYQKLEVREIVSLTSEFKLKTMVYSVMDCNFIGYFIGSSKIHR